MKYKKGEWVTIVKNKDDEFFNKYIGRAAPILEVNEDMQAYALPLRREGGSDNNSVWGDSEVRLATPKEIKEARPLICAEML